MYQQIKQKAYDGYPKNINNPPFHPGKLVQMPQYTLQLDT